MKVKVIPVTGITLSSTELNIEVGGKQTLQAEVKPEDATDKSVTWSSSDPSVATVDGSTGEVTGVSEGTATIYCTTSDGSVSAACLVECLPAVVPVESITLDTDAVSLSVGETTVLAATVSPEDATDKSVTWSSSDPSVAEVDPTGKVVAKSAGEATVTCTSSDGAKTASCSVTVSDTVVPVTNVTLSTSSLSLTVGQTRQLRATVHPSDATNKAVTWRSNASSIASVSSDGVVTGKSAGVAIVSVFTEDGSKSASCRVTVTGSSIAVTGVSLDRTSLDLSVGSEVKLNATVSPSNASNTGLTWTSSVPSVATVSQDGVVKAVSAGSTVITVKTDDGGKTATAKVSVSSDAPSSFSMIPRRDGSSGGENIFRYNAEGDYLLTTTDDMNAVLYKQLNLSMNQFHAVYDAIKMISGEGTVSDVVINDKHHIKWFIDGGDLLYNSGKNVSATARYYNLSNQNLYKDVLLTASVAERATTINLSSAIGDYVAEYWTSGYEAVGCYTNIPAQGESSPENCQFAFDINKPFRTYPKGDANAGNLEVEDLEYVEYSFCKDITKVTKIGDYSVKFRVADGGESLYATVDNKTELVASIINEPTMVYANKIWNRVTFNKEGSVACKLLNTGSLFVYISAFATLTTGETLQIVYDGMDHFRLNFIRPINVATIASNKFIDGVDFGEKGSYIKVEDFVIIYDWRSRSFDQYSNYFGYYGPVEVVVDVDNAMCDIGGTRQKLPQNLFLFQTEPGATSVVDPATGSQVALPHNEWGYLMFGSGSQPVNSDFRIFIQVKVKYGFGEIVTDWITIPVSRLIATE